MSAKLFAQSCKAQKLLRTYVRTVGSRARGILKVSFEADRVRVTTSTPSTDSTRHIRTTRPTSKCARVNSSLRGVHLYPYRHFASLYVSWVTACAMGHAVGRSVHIGEALIMAAAPPENTHYTVYCTHLPRGFQVRSGNNRS